MPLFSESRYIHPPILASNQLDGLSLFRHYQAQKEKTISSLSALTGTRELLTAYLHQEKGSNLQNHSQADSLQGRWRFFMVATIFQNGHKRATTLPHQQKAQNHRQKVKDLLPNRIVGYSPDLARAVGGATIGLFLSQLLFLSDKGANPDGWVYKSEQEMGRETGLTKREQQTARRKLLSLGVIAIERRGFKFTYHFKIIWERLYQVIENFQRGQTVPTEKVEPVQNVPTQPEQNVATDPPECLQNVSTQWKQNVGTLNRENNTENTETEKTIRENQKTWDETREKLQSDLPLGETAARLNGTILIEVTDTAARIGVSNPFAIAWLERRMYRQISKAMKGVLGKDLDLQFVTTT
jgi:hypothetical protein